MVKLVCSQMCLVCEFDQESQYFNKSLRRTSLCDCPWHLSAICSVQIFALKNYTKHLMI